MSAPEWIGAQVQVSPDLDLRGGWTATAYEADGRSVRRTWAASSLEALRAHLVGDGVFSEEQALQVEARVIAILRSTGLPEEEIVACLGEAA